MSTESLRQTLDCIKKAQAEYDVHLAEHQELWRQFGASIRVMRKTRGVSLKKFSKLLGYSTAMIALLETGKRQWTHEKARGALKFLSRLPIKNKTVSSDRSQRGIRMVRLAALMHPQRSEAEIVRLRRECSATTARTGIQHHVDHIIPITHGGWHHELNMQVIPGWMNSRKKNNPYWLSPSKEYKDWRHVPVYLWPLKLVPAYCAKLLIQIGEIDK